MTLPIPKRLPGDVGSIKVGNNTFYFDLPVEGQRQKEAHEMVKPSHPVYSVLRDLIEVVRAENANNTLADVCDSNPLQSEIRKYSSTVGPVKS